MAAPLVARIMVEHAGGAAAGGGGGGTPPSGGGGGMSWEGAMKAAQSEQQRLKDVISSGNEEAESGGNRHTQLMKDIGAKAQEYAKKTNGYAKGQLSKTLGMSVGIASILKQSQVFTGYVGTIFQLLGALVDVILAPFLPILIPAIRLIASMIPIIGDYSKKVFNFLDGTLFAVIRALGSVLPKGVGTVIKRILAGLILGLFFAKIFGIGKAFFGGTKAATVGTYKTMQAMFAAMTQGNSIFVKDVSMGKMVGRQGGMAKGRHLKMMRMGGARNMLLMSGFGMMGRVFTGIGNTLKGGFSLLRGGQGANQAATRLVPEAVKNSSARNVGILTRVGQGIMAGVRGARGFIGAGIRAGWRQFAQKFPRLAGAMSRVGASIMRNGGRLLRGITGLPGLIKTKLGPLFTSLKTAFLKTGVGRAIASGLGKLKTGLGNAFKNTVGKVLPKAGLGTAMKGMLTGARAIPLLGAAVELGYGGYKTFKSFKDYGMDAGFARMGVTLGATVGSLFDPTGIGSAALSIGAHEGLNYLERKGAFGEKKGDTQQPAGDVYINVTQQTTEGLDVNHTGYMRQDQDRRNDITIPATVHDR